MHHEFLKDTSTHFMHHVSLLPELEKKLHASRALGLIVVDIGPLDRIEQSFGQEVLSELCQKLSSFFLEMQGNIIRKDDLIAMSELGSTSFMIFLGTSRSKQDEGKILSSQNLKAISKRIEEFLVLKLTPLLYPYQKGFPRISLGYSLTVYNPLMRKRRLIARLIEEAREIARAKSRELFIRYKSELQRIIVERDIYSVYQPIVHLTTGKTFAYEALSRGPKNSVFESPLILFAIAEETGMTLELDRLCRYMSILNSQYIRKPGARIFVNTLCDSILDPEFSTQGFEKLLKEIGKKPSDIVFEINERSFISNIETFRFCLDRYRQLGTYFALDDVGSGYASLQTMMKLKPLYCKLDRSICSGAQENDLKQETLSWFKRLSEDMGSSMIAEGIENEAEMDYFKRLGCTYAQGWHIGYPAEPHLLS